MFELRRLVREKARSGGEFERIARANEQRRQAQAELVKEKVRVPANEA